MSAIERLNIDINEISALNKKDLSEAQAQTQQTFAYEWSRQEAYESEEHKEVRRKWMLEKYCNNDPSMVDQWLEGGEKIIMDAGCGSGYAALIFWGDHLKNHHYLGVDISDAVEIGKEKFKEAGCPGDFIQVNLLDLPLLMKVLILYSQRAYCTIRTVQLTLLIIYRRKSNLVDASCSMCMLKRPQYVSFAMTILGKQSDLWVTKKPGRHLSH